MILDEILAHKRQEVAERRAQRPLSALTEAAHAALATLRASTLEVSGDSIPGRVEATREAAEPSAQAATADGPFATALRQPGVGVIAEFKRKSPSGGSLRADASPADIARLYAVYGAAAMSVLTDARYFGGSDDDLVAARRASRLPVLRKDFVIDAYQLYEARAIGADAVLLIVRALADAELRAMLELAAELQLDALVETHSEQEVRRALEAGASLIGVNNRDLDTLTTDVSLAPRLRPLVPPECVFVAESGISSPDQVASLRDAGVDAVLIGESLLRAGDPGAQLAALVSAGQPVRVEAPSA